MRAVRTLHGLRRMSLLRLVGEPLHGADVEPFPRGKEQPEQERWADREQVQHDGGADGRFVRRAVERGRADPKRLVKPAHRAGRRHRNTEREQRDHEKRTGERDRETEGHRHRPDAERDAEPQRQRPRQRGQETPRTANRAEAAGELLGDSRDHARQRRRQHLFEPRHGAAQPFRIARQHEQHDERGARHERGARPGPLDERKAGRVHAGEIFAEHEHEGRQQREHRDDVEQSLEDDRRKGTGRGHASLLVTRRLSRQEIRANDLTGPRRENRARREPDRRRPKRARERGGSQRLEQVFPTQRANRQIGERRQQRQGQPFRPRSSDRGQYAPEIHVGQEQHDQREGDRQNNDGAHVGSHGP